MTGTRVNGGRYVYEKEGNNREEVAEGREDPQASTGNRYHVNTQMRFLSRARGVIPALAAACCTTALCEERTPRTAAASAAAIARQPRSWEPCHEAACSSAAELAAAALRGGPSTRIGGARRPASDARGTAGDGQSGTGDRRAGAGEAVGGSGVGGLGAADDASVGGRAAAGVLQPEALQPCPLSREALGLATWQMVRCHAGGDGLPPRQHGACTHSLPPHRPTPPLPAQLHTFAAYYPERPASEDVAAANGLVHALARLYPCSHCRAAFASAVEAAPLDASSRAAFAVWACEQHNAVNTALGKPRYPCDAAALDARWRSAVPPDGCALDARAGSEAPIADDAEDGSSEDGSSA